MEFIMGGIINFGGNYAPRDWAFCNGQLVPISQNQALFAILGTTWGGDGRTNFAMPDMRSRVPIGIGRGIGLTEVYQGEMSGSETHTMHILEMPTHSHDAIFSPTGGGGGSSTSVTIKAGTASDASSPDGKYWGVTKNGLAPLNGYANSADTTMASDAVVVSGGGGGITGGTVSIGSTGNGREFSLMNPNLGMAYIISMQGIFPSRN